MVYMLVCMPTKGMDILCFPSDLEELSGLMVHVLYMPTKRYGHTCPPVPAPPVPWPHPALPTRPLLSLICGVGCLVQWRKVDACRKEAS
jgi:hypothetical protein